MICKCSSIVLWVLVIFVACTGGVAAGEVVLEIDAPGDTKLAEEENIAELALWEMADRALVTRQFYGKSMLLAGSGLVVLGVIVTDVPEGQLLAVTAGVAAMISGGFMLLIPDVEELEWARVKEIANPDEREFAAQSSLSYLAGKAHQARMISGITNSALAAFYLYSLITYDDEYPSLTGRDVSLSYFLNYTGSAIKAFIFPSYAEEVYQEVLEGKTGSGMELYYAIGFAGSAAYNFLVPSYVEKAYKEVQEVKAAKVSFQIGKFTGVVASVSF